MTLLVTPRLNIEHKINIFVEFKTFIVQLESVASHARFRFNTRKFLAKLNSHLHFHLFSFFAFSHSQNHHSPLRLMTRIPSIQKVKFSVFRATPRKMKTKILNWERVGTWCRHKIFRWHVIESSLTSATSHRCCSSSLSMSFVIIISRCFCGFLMSPPLIRRIEIWISWGYEMYANFKILFWSCMHLFRVYQNFCRLNFSWNLDVSSSLTGLKNSWNFRNCPTHDGIDFVTHSKFNSTYLTFLLYDDDEMTTRWRPKTAQRRRQEKETQKKLSE